MADEYGLIVMGGDYSFFQGSRTSAEMARRIMLALRNEDDGPALTSACAEAGLKWLGNVLPNQMNCRDTHWATMIAYSPGALPASIDHCLRGRVVLCELCIIPAQAASSPSRCLEHQDMLSIDEI